MRGFDDEGISTQPVGFGDVADVTGIGQNDHPKDL
jgi:hypothetical protein